ASYLTRPQASRARDGTVHAVFGLRMQGQLKRPRQSKLENEIMDVTRRTILTATAATAALSFVGAPHIARAALPLTQPGLPFAEDALAPTISSKTVGLHYGKHHKAYFDKLN
ncbi:MAG: hypothetical protein U5N27_06200, partial [Rhizobium sp.]|nr:hypothetical protein [Rhizobium sp.]